MILRRRMSENQRSHDRAFLGVRDMAIVGEGIAPVSDPACSFGLAEVLASALIRAIQS